MNKSENAGRIERTNIIMRLEEAADTLRRVPAPTLRPVMSNWPAIVRDTMESLLEAPRCVRLYPASPQAIDRMHDTFTWFIALENQPQLAKALWLTCACKLGPKRVGVILGCHRDTVRTRREEALELITKHLNRQQRQAA